MSNKPPTYRERAIATGVNNHAAARDLMIDLASEIDKLTCVAESPSASEDEKTDAQTETEEK